MESRLEWRERRGEWSHSQTDLGTRLD